jgi:hypothetical protein
MQRNEHGLAVYKTPDIRLAVDLRKNADQLTRSVSPPKPAFWDIPNQRLASPVVSIIDSRGSRVERVKLRCEKGRIVQLGEAS